MVYPILKHFVLTVIAKTGHLRAEVNSFSCLCSVLDMLQNLKKGIGSPTELAKVIKQHMASFLAVYTPEDAKPKHHFLVHIPAQVARDGLLLDCFVLERKHQMLKACCNWIDNTCSFEKSTLARAVLEQRRELDKPGWTAHGLQGQPNHFRFKALAKRLLRLECMCKASA